MLFAPDIAELLATRTNRRRHAPTAPRARRALLRGVWFPHRTTGAAAVRRLLHSLPRSLRAPRAEGVDSGARRPQGR
jgi:hypothetical protein